MSVVKRGAGYSLAIRPFGGKLVYVATSARSKTEAKQIEAAVLTAIRANDFRALDVVARETCVRLFQNQGLELPSTLSGEEPVRYELTLWKGAELFLNYPDTKRSRERERYASCFVHLVTHFGKDCLVKSIWVPQIKQYIAERVNAGVSPSQVNREKGTLSKMFQVLNELELVQENPCRLIPNLSQKSEERMVYLSFQDVQTITEGCPEWLQPIIWTGYCTGMRQGEILGLSRSRLRLGQRIALLGPEHTKEGHWKRVPLHKELIPILEETMRIRQIGTDKVFTREGQSIERHLIRPAWDRAVKALETETKPRFHDLRHTWRANARRSGVDSDIAESILGHWDRGHRVNERYGRVSDSELLAAVDRITFDHGETEIWAARREENKCFVSKT